MTPARQAELLAATMRKPTANLTETEASNRLAELRRREHAGGFNQNHDTRPSERKPYRGADFDDFRVQWQDVMTQDQ